MLTKLYSVARKDYQETLALGAVLTAPTAKGFDQSNLLGEGDRLGVPLDSDGSCLGVCLMYGGYYLGDVKDKVKKLNSSPDLLRRKKFLHTLLLLQTQALVGHGLPLKKVGKSVSSFDLAARLPNKLSWAPIVGLSFASKAGYGHIIAIINSPGQYSIFDPNFGEVANLTTSALSLCLDILIGYYHKVDDLTVHSAFDLREVFNSTVTLIKDKPQLMSLTLALSNCKAVSYLMKMGVDVNQEYVGEQETPLWVACAQGHKKAVELLLHAKADTQIVGVNGLSCLQVAEKYGRKEIVELLKSFSQKTNQGLSSSLSVIQSTIFTASNASVKIAEHITKIRTEVIARSLAELAMA
jgi:hypothetical protein